MRPLSESLADMSVRAKSVEDHAAAARQETHEQITARMEQVKADARRRSEAARADGQRRIEQAKAHRDEVEQEIAGHWADMRKSLAKQAERVHWSAPSSNCTPRASASPSWPSARNGSGWRATCTTCGGTTSR